MAVHGWDRNIRLGSGLAIATWLLTGLPAQAGLGRIAEDKGAIPYSEMEMESLGTAAMQAPTEPPKPANAPEASPAPPSLTAEPDAQVPDSMPQASPLPLTDEAPEDSQDIEASPAPLPQGTTEPLPESPADLPAPSPEETPAAAEPKPDTPDQLVPPELNRPGSADPSVDTDTDEPLTEDERVQLLIEGDRLWLQGRYAEAEVLYRKAKEPGEAFTTGARPAPFADPELLSPAGQVYWREAQAGRDLNLETRMMVPLELLTQEYPEFIPGHLLYAELLLEQDRVEEALLALEHATTFYPNEAELMLVRVNALAEYDHLLEASIAARQFAVLNPDHPQASEFEYLAAEYLDEFKDDLRERLTVNAIANVITGAVGYALTGGLFGPFSAINTTVLLLRGESDIGEAAANQASRQLPMIQDEEVVGYVNELGQRMAAMSGRDEFEYEFYVVDDPSLNAFALPGGKIFINAGAIAQTDSEAELAALIAHELSHSILSHGFQMVIQGNLTANILQFVPYGGILTDLAVLSYSRDMERQADALGTRMLATAGYAADGLQNLMVTLGEQHEDYPLEWLSTHPDTDERIRNISTQIDRNGYNRYAYEGVERHLDMRDRVEALLSGEAK
jgi:Zn-dependent protease with chaperone function